MNTHPVPDSNTVHNEISLSLMKSVIVHVQTQRVRSAMEFAEALFETVQRTMAPGSPKSATAWLTHLTLLSLHRLDYDPDYRQVADGYWRELICYSIRDLANFTSARICVSDLPALLNKIRWEQGMGEVLELIETLKTAQRCYPSAFIEGPMLPLRELENI